MKKYQKGFLTGGLEIAVAAIALGLVTGLWQMGQMQENQQQVNEQRLEQVEQENAELKQKLEEQQ